MFRTPKGTFNGYSLEHTSQEVSRVLTQLHLDVQLDLMVNESSKNLRV